ncbi:MAG: glutamine--fructose-6-phosphate transaminase (isomerizing) [Lewinellaceae bacterium]|nr:glutamine--fructose-6-phosphate transaminase (isomerizing) [Phaeodactylibacter sp.]MCB9040594.1 glutamine--fructose-6-phosphate transaminase (isomerizing) [Lewinellaceae bacterium]
MCGIVAYIGDKQAFPILIKGLKKLEYRGYDSAGVALLNGDLNVYKKKGKVGGLESFIRGKQAGGNIGIGHTRWATHGVPNDVNSHPHLSTSGRLSLVHNGIIENYASLKVELIQAGHQFKSETDTEVLANLIEEAQKANGVALEEAVRLALAKVEGAYAIVVIDKEEPDKLVAARKSSPLVVGIGNNEFYLASDGAPIVEYTRKVIYLKDEEIATLNRAGTLTIKSFSNELQSPDIQELDIEVEMLEKGGYDSFMLKEIFEQPQTIAACLSGRLDAGNAQIQLHSLEPIHQRLYNASRFVIVGCATSWHSGLVGKHLFESLAKIPVEVDYASEYRYRDTVLSDKDLVIAISQSGETADTLAVLPLAKEKGAATFGIVNTVGSSIARMTDGVGYIHAGPEIGVASTKAFTGQVALLAMMALKIATEKKNISERLCRQLIKELSGIPQKVSEILKLDAQIKYIAGEIKEATSAIYLGRGYNFPAALEGALKLKEVSYIHAEGYPAAEMKHGPIALIDENMPVIVVATNRSAYEKIVSNIQEVKARKGIVIAIVVKGDQEIREMADYTIEIPETAEQLTPLLSIVPLQLLAYHVATMRGCDVDQPRNLAKSVTVE